VDINLVRPHPDNPSSGDEDAIEESILISGMYRPIYVQTSTGYILAGNTTYAVCMRLRAEQIPVVWLDVDNVGALRILLGDNQLARLALVDQALLKPQLEALLATEMRLLGTGFTEPESQVPENDTVPPPIEPAHMVCVNLTGDEMVAWFDLDGDTDRDRLLGLLENWAVDR
jgi:ParB-like chromosome segregation protein Spo0J